MSPFFLLRTMLAVSMIILPFNTFGVVPSGSTVIVEWSEGSAEAIGSAAVSLIGLPFAPQNLAAMPVESHVALSWSSPASDGGSQVLSYNLYRGSGLTSSLLVTVSAPENRFNDTEVSGGISYRYYVTAVNVAGEGPPSETVSVIVPRSASGQAGAGMILIGILVLMVIGIATRIALVLIASKELKK